MDASTTQKPLSTPHQPVNTYLDLAASLTAKPFTRGISDKCLHIIRSFTSTREFMPLQSTNSIIRNRLRSLPSLPSMILVAKSDKVISTLLSSVVKDFRDEYAYNDQIALSLVTLLAKAGNIEGALECIWGSMAAQSQPGALGEIAIIMASFKDYKGIKEVMQKISSHAEVIKYSKEVRDQFYSKIYREISSEMAKHSDFSMAIFYLEKIVYPGLRQIQQRHLRTCLFRFVSFCSSFRWFDLDVKNKTYVYPCVRCCLHIKNKHMFIKLIKKKTTSFDYV